MLLAIFFHANLFGQITRVTLDMDIHVVDRAADDRTW